MRHQLVLLLFLILLGNRWPAFGQNVVIEGVITDTSSAPVSYATINVKGDVDGAAADRTGHYRLELSPGNYTLQYRALGYQMAERTVILGPNEYLQLNVTLASEPLSLGQVVVEDKRSYPTPSTYRMSAESIKNAPAMVLPDVVRTVSLLPGVMLATDRKAALNVRGGAADQNLFLLDGVRVYQPAHLLGVFSAFNVWALGGATFYAGTFPARYGGRLSSVMALQTKSRRDSSITKANVSLISLSGVATRERDDTFVMAAARRAYLDLVLAVAAVPLGYSFYDANLKVVHQLRDGWALEAMGFLSRDASSAYAIAAQDESLQSRAEWGNYLGALRLRYNGKRMSHRLTGSFVRRFSQSHYPPAGDRIHTGFNDFSLQYDGMAAVRNSRFRFGLNYRRLTTDYGWESARISNIIDDMLYPGLPSNFSASDEAPLYSAYSSVEHYLTPRLRLRAGLRYTALDQIASGEPAPRLDASYRIIEGVRLTASAGRYIQFVAEGTEGVALTTGEPLFLLSRPQLAWTYAVGATGSLADGTYRLSAEAYYRDFDDVARLEREPGAPFPNLVAGAGTASGLDVFLRKQRGWFTYQVAYSFLRARSIRDDNTFPPAWSAPHTLQGLLGFRIGHYWKISLAGTFRSGLPYTAVIGRFPAPSDDEPDRLSPRFIPGERNGERFDPYTRIDLSVRRMYHAKSFNWTLYVQIMNLLNSANNIHLDWDEQYDRYNPTTDAYSFPQTALPIIPSVGVEFTF